MQQRAERQPRQEYQTELWKPVSHTDPGNRSCRPAFASRPTRVSGLSLPTAATATLTQNTSKHTTHNRRNAHAQTRTLTRARNSTRAQTLTQARSHTHEPSSQTHKCTARNTHTHIRIHTCAKHSHSSMHALTNAHTHTLIRALAHTHARAHHFQALFMRSVRNVRLR